MNEAGGTAYEFSAEHALAQLAVTGCLNSTYYVNAQTQLSKILEVCDSVSPEYIAKAAIYARNRGYMKDVPALLCAYLAKDIGRKFEEADRAYAEHKAVAGSYNGGKTKKGLDERYEETYTKYLEVEADAFKHRQTFESAFRAVIRNPKMLRNFVQIIRSGATGRKSLGSLPRKIIRQWLDERSDEQLFIGSVGNDPSLADVIKLVHPTPKNSTREALYAYLIGKEHSKAKLPKLVKEYEKFKKGDSVEVPDVPFMMLSSWPLDTEIWIEIAKNAPWYTTMANLNTFERHGVFQDKKMVRLVAEKLRDREAIHRSKVFPFKILTAFKFYNRNHEALSDALQDAIDIAVENLPEIDGRVLLLPDTSGSMQSPVTGFRGSATTKLSCAEAAGFFAAVMFKKNKESRIIPFGSSAVPDFSPNRRDSVATIARQISSIHGGGTNISAPLATVNHARKNYDLVIYLSDNESWVDSNINGKSNLIWTPGYRHKGTETMLEWAKLQSRNKKAKLVCLDLQPNTSTQAIECKDILNIGGFSNVVFDLVYEFYNGNLDPAHWVGEIEKISLDNGRFRE